MHFQIRVRVRDSVIFEKVKYGCSNVRQLKNYLKYFYLYFLYIFTIKIFLKNTLLCLDSQNKERRRQETQKKTQNDCILSQQVHWMGMKANFDCSGLIQGQFWPFQSISTVSVAGQNDPILAESEHSSVYHRFLMKVSILVNGSILVLLWLILIWGFNSSC